ncbi:MAG: sulfatase [Myxococcales bacterium]|nr:sulfatase [Myxococcales bacterium]
MTRDARTVRLPTVSRLAVLAVASLVALLDCGPEPAPPNLVLIVIDTLRADHLGAYGYPRDTSPTMDGLAAAGSLFLNATAPSSWTKPSIGSLFTSRYPSEHGAVSFEHDLGGELSTLAELLRQRGYHTLAANGNFVHVTEPRGFARGFDVWSADGIEVPPSAEGALLTVEIPEGEPVALRAPTAREINRVVEEKLGTLHGGPLFLYVHYMEPHPGFDPPPRHLERFLRDPDRHAAAPPATAAYISMLARGEIRPDPGEVERLIDLYDAEISAVDEAIGDLRRVLAEAGFASPILMIVADHGEEFLDHGGWFHGIHLHGEVLRVPMILHDPRRAGAARRVAEPVDLLDVAPTLLALAGAPIGTQMRGRNLLAEGAPLAGRDIVAELHPDPVLAGHLRPRSHRFAVTRWPWKLIAHGDGRTEVYRKDRDPAETDPLDARVEGMPADLARAGAALWRAPEAIAGGSAAPDLDDEVLHGLRALGYAE